MAVAVVSSGAVTAVAAMAATVAVLVVVVVAAHNIRISWSAVIAVASSESSHTGINPVVIL